MTGRLLRKGGKMGTLEETEYPRVFSPLAKGPITQFVLEGKQVKSPEVPHEDVVSISSYLFVDLFYMLRPFNGKCQQKKTKQDKTMSSYLQ